MGFKQKRARSALNKLAAAYGHDFNKAAAELERRFGTTDPLKLSDEQALRFIADMGMGAYAVTDFARVDELDEDKPVPSTDGSRKPDITDPAFIAEVYARYNRRKAGVKIVGHSPRDEDDDLDAPE